MLAEMIKSRQWDLLRMLVQYTFEGKLKDPIAPIPSSAGDYVIYLYGTKSLQLQWISDLDVLCKQGYLSYKWNRMSNGKLYSLTNAGIQAAMNQHQYPLNSFKQNMVEDRLEIMPATIQTPKSVLKEIRSMNPQLRQALTKALPANDFVAISRTIAHIIQYLESANPTLPQLHHFLNLIGQQLVTALSNCTTIETSQHISRAFALFGDWSEQAVTLLGMLEAYREEKETTES